MDNTTINLSNMGSVLGRDSIHSARISRVQDPKDSKPVWVIGKKPQTKIINYMSSSGHEVVKVSMDHPNLK